MQGRQKWQKLALWGAAYLAVGLLVWLIQPESGVSPWYPPIAMGIVMTLRFGWAALPVILLADVPIGLLQQDGHSLTALIVGLGTVLEAALVRVLLLRFPRAKAVRSATALFLVVGACAIATAAVPAIFTPVVALLPGSLETDWQRLWGQWAAGDATSAVCLVPVILLLGRRQSFARTRLPEFATVLAAPFVGALATAALNVRNPEVIEYRYLAYLPLVWAAVRLTSSQTAAVALTSNLALVMLDGSSNPVERTREGLLNTQLLLMSMTLAGLITSLMTEAERQARRVLERTLERVRLAEGRFRAIAEHSGDMISLRDRDARIVYVNPASQTHIGVAPEGALGRRVDEIVPMQTMPALPFDRHRFHVNIDGEPRHMESVMVALPEQEDPHYVVVTRDITDQVSEAERLAELNAELERRVHERTSALEEANAELEAFSAALAHDLKAPLRAIGAFAVALREDVPLGAVGTSHLRRIEDANRRLVLMTEGLARLSRVNRRPVQPAEVDLSGVAERTLDALRIGNPDVPLEAMIQPGLVAEGDPGMLGVLLENLLGNAVKFSSKVEAPRIEFGQDAKSLYVRDNGTGFDMRYAAKLFEPFKRLHSASEFPGTGLGLATCERIIRRHGGQIWAESRPGEGATFRFTLGKAS